MAQKSLRTWSNRFVLTICVAILAVAVPSSPAQQSARWPASPNLLVIIADDHAAWTLGIDGDPRRATPNLDALARQGTLFKRAYCNSPVCTPSRQSLITGKLPHAIGVTQLATRLSDDVLTLGEWFRDLDFATAAIGKMHFNGPSAHGFDVRIDTPDWERNLREHPPRGGDRRRPWRPILDPAREWLNAERLADGVATGIDAVDVLRRSRDRISQREARPTVRDDRQLLRAA